MADAKIDEKKETWWNYHHNVSVENATIYEVYNPRPIDGVASLMTTASEIQTKILAKAAAGNFRLRAIGGSWSLSRAVDTDGRLIRTTDLAANFMLKEDDLDAGFSGDKTSLLYTQGGMSVDAINAKLKDKKRSLKAAGASNGQTIAGAISTGTHGSALYFGALHDAVVALQIITGPDKIIWLERDDYPVVSKEFADSMKSEIVRNNDLFYSAVVSVGSFGFIYGVVLETDPAFLLTTNRTILNIDNTLMNAMSKADPSILNIQQEITLNNGDKARLYHFEVTVNPNTPAKAWVTTMYKSIYPWTGNPQTIPGYEIPKRGSMNPAPDLLSNIGRLADFSGQLNIMLSLLSSAFVTVPFTEMGTYGEIFRASPPRGEGTSTEIGFHPSNISKVLKIIIEASNSKGPFTGFAAFRFVKATKAKIAFTRFSPVTCTVELVGLNNDVTHDFYIEVWNQLAATNIEHTFHWGQENNYTAQSVRKNFTSQAVDTWINSRKQLLSPLMQEIFSNSFLRGCGLT